MKSRIGLFLAAVALVGAALVSGPTKAEASRCIEPACFASPGCCFDWQCDSWCGGSGFGLCSGGGTGGCCYCAG
ncbi:MAG TPA: hypothetical protein VGX68_20620 [Thermoanaerobaculia bacterium]|jgi:hypothetical protein|nr:hypothetical protein [Thermoanaerobaculia bacterium]